MDWQDREFVQQYMCANTEIAYNQVEKFELIEKDKYEESIKWKFDCSVFPWEDHNMLQVHHYFTNDKN